LFFHKFFSQKNEKERARAAKVDKRKDNEDDTIPRSRGAIDDLAQHVTHPDEASDSEGIDIKDDDDSDSDETEIWKVGRVSHLHVT
jgi:ribosome biogenesis protein MAK21